MQIIPPGSPLDAEGNLPVSALITKSGTAATLTLEDYEPGVETDTEQLVVGISGQNRVAGLGSVLGYHVKTGLDETANGVRAVAVHGLAVDKLITLTKEGVGYIDDASIVSATTETTFTVDDGTAFRVGDLLTWGTDQPTGSGTFDDTAFSGEWMLVTSISANNLTVTRAYKGSAASIADGLNLYRIDKRLRVQLHFWGGRYHVASGILLAVNGIEIICPDGPEQTLFYREASGSLQYAVRIRGAGRVVRGLGVVTETADSPTLFTALDLVLDGDSLIKDVRSTTELTNTNIYTVSLTEATARDLPLRLEDCLAQGSAWKLNGARIELLRTRLTATADGVLGSNFTIGGACSAIDSRLVSPAAGTSGVILYANEADAFFYNTDILATSGTASINIQVGGEDEPITVAHCRLSHEVYDSSVPAAANLADFNTITTAYNVIDANLK